MTEGQIGHERDPHGERGHAERRCPSIGGRHGTRGHSRHEAAQIDTRVVVGIRGFPTRIRSRERIPESDHQGRLDQRVTRDQCDDRNPEARRNRQVSAAHRGSQAIRDAPEPHRSLNRTRTRHEDDRRQEQIGTEHERAPDGERPAMAEEAVGNPAAYHRQRVHQAAEDSQEGQRRLVLPGEPARRAARRKKQSQQRDHRIEADALAELEPDDQLCAAWEMPGARTRSRPSFLKSRGH